MLLAKLRTCAEPARGCLEVLGSLFALMTLPVLIFVIVLLGAVLAFR